MEDKLKQKDEECNMLRITIRHLREELENKPSTIQIISHSVTCFALGFVIAMLISRLEEICLS